MGNTFDKLKDPHLVLKVQELLGVRQISVEVDQNSASSNRVPESNSSGEDSSEEGAATPSGPQLKPDDGKPAEAEGEKVDTPSNKEPLNNLTQASSKSLKRGSLSWIKSKARVRRRIRTPPLQHSPRSSASPSPSGVETLSSTQVLVVETIPFLDIYFRLATELGYEPFYITFLPFIFWNVDAMVARHVIVTWCISMYIGQFFKQIFKIKRPASPPAIRLEDNPSLETEYGFPSTHATVGTSIPFCLLYTVIGRYEVPVWLCVCLAILWCISVLLSRIYLGVHSLLDIVVGSVIAVVMLPLVILGLDMIDYHIFHTPYCHVYILLAVIFLLYIYPVDKEHWSKDRGDTAAILGSSMGFLLGMCYSGPLPEDLDLGPYAISLPSIQDLSLYIVRFIVGLLLLLPTRFVMKLLCFKLLPVIMPTHGVQEVVKRPLVELPYKIITYGAIGFNAVVLSKVVFEICGISRWT